MSGNFIIATTDTQPTGFTQVPNAILKANVSLGARMLYSILLSYCWHKTSCFPSYETLMNDMHCGSQALSRYIKELITHGLIAVVRRGNGKTNVYQLTNVVQPAPTQQSPPAGEANHADNPSALKIKEQELRKSKTEEYSSEKYEERDLSNSRKTEREGDYVNSSASTTPPEAVHPPQTGRRDTVNSSTAQQHTGSTTYHTPSSIETSKNRNGQKQPAPAREKMHDPEREAYRGMLLEYLQDFTGEFRDEAPLTSSITRAYNLFRQSGVSMNAFIDCLYSARLTTKERTGSIRKYTADGYKTKMAYFFAVLEDRLGLRKPGPVKYG
jgi:hypothetical protein